MEHYKTEPRALKSSKGAGSTIKNSKTIESMQSAIISRFFLIATFFKILYPVF